jgi:hypothetical protein
VAVLTALRRASDNEDLALPNSAACPVSSSRNGRITPVAEDDCYDRMALDVETGVLYHHPARELTDGAQHGAKFAIIARVDGLNMGRAVYMSDGPCCPTGGGY